ncbi:hypothetical protein EON64_19065 [archaeon]|nr:MAG: hypothetical protein EON64_19065 [archaeon]
MDLGVHLAKPRRLGRHERFDVLGEYLEVRDPFGGYLLGRMVRIARRDGHLELTYPATNFSMLWYE